MKNLNSSVTILGYCQYSGLVYLRYQVWILAGFPALSYEVFRGFPQCLQVTNRVVLEIVHDCLLSNLYLFTFHYYLPNHEAAFINKCMLTKLYVYILLSGNLSSKPDQHFCCCSFVSSGIIKLSDGHNIHPSLWVHWPIFLPLNFND
jgi:hypothetical protein